MGYSLYNSILRSRQNCLSIGHDYKLFFSKENLSKTYRAKKKLSVQEGKYFIRNRIIDLFIDP